MIFLSVVSATFGKHKPTTADAVVSAIVIATTQSTQAITIKVVVIISVRATHEPEATTFFVLRHNFVAISQVTPSTDFSATGRFEVFLGIFSIPIVPQLLGIVADGIPRPF